VPFRDYQQVARRDRLKIHERDHMIVLENNARFALSMCDLAENAIVVLHSCSQLISVLTV
jgi:hypothetical protein